MVQEKRFTNIHYVDKSYVVGTQVSTELCFQTVCTFAYKVGKIKSRMLTLNSGSGMYLLCDPGQIT